MKIEMTTIPHDQHRYETVGDWWFGDDGSIVIKVSDMGNEDYSFLVAMHEAIEVWLCRKRGISEESVLAFDIEYEKNRPEGDFSEPGDDPKAPYQKEHQFATKIERMICDELGIEWQQYNDTVEKL